MHHGEFLHPRLAALYDVDCPWGQDDDFFASVVAETPGAHVLDMGCGTGRLTVALAAAGHRVTGVEPAAASLAVARTKPYADRVTWIEGTSTVLPERAFDVAVLTSHVAQFILGDDEWADALADLARALVPGGRLVFDSRDPADRRWERWNPTDTRRQLTLPDGTPVEIWTEVTAVRDSMVSFTHHYVFPDEELLSHATLRFRSEHDLRTSLAAAGFTVEHVYGGWQRQPVGAGHGEFLVIARRDG